MCVCERERERDGEGGGGRLREREITACLPPLPCEQLESKPMIHTRTFIPEIHSRAMYQPDAGLQTQSSSPQHLSQYPPPPALSYSQTVVSAMILFSYSPQTHTDAIY